MCRPTYPVFDNFTLSTQWPQTACYAGEVEVSELWQLFLFYMYLEQEHASRIRCVKLWLVVERETSRDVRAVFGNRVIFLLKNVIA